MDVRKAIGNYLTVISSEGIEPLERVRLLIISLDDLAAAYHQADYIFDETDYPDAPEKDYKKARERIAPLFPSLGIYNCALHISSNSEDGKICVGDAIDDIVDIEGDLIDVLWRFENTSENDALWQFKFGFETHWGMHMRSLQLYLHDFHW